MSLSVRTYITCTIFGLGVAGVIFLVVQYRQEQAAADMFFSSVLQKVRMEETVVVRGRSFRVYDGRVDSVDGASVSPIAARNALRLAYARTVASRAPLLSVAGSDPQLLEDSTRRLAEVMNELAGVQKTAQDALALQSLYPIRFLSSLAELERARRAFTVSGTDADGDMYRASLKRALTVGRQDSADFRNAYERETAGKTARFQGFGGVMSVRSMQDTIRNIEMRFGELQNNAEGLDKCLSGRIEYCYPDSLLLGREFSPSAVKTPRVSAASSALMGEVRALYAETFTERASSIFTDSTPIALSRSVCLDVLPYPYVVVLGNTDPLGIPPIWYVGDIIFTPLDNAEAKMPQYLYKKYDIRYSRINPMMFYVCPDVGSDLARARAVRASAEFAQRHPDSARTYRTQLLSAGGVWYESDAYTYMREAIRDVSAREDSLSEIREVEEIALMWSGASSGLDVVVANIVRNARRNLTAYAEGAPVDISAQTLFLSHAAFPTLFLATDESRETLRIVSDGQSKGSSGILSTRVSYADLRFTERRDRIAHDLRAFLVYEGAKF